MGSTPETRLKEDIIGDALYKSSPYYKHLHSDISAAETVVWSDDRGQNTYYIDGFVRYLEMEHLAWLPMLNRTFVKDEVNPKTKLLTNNYVEKWFSLVSRWRVPCKCVAVARAHKKYSCGCITDEKSMS